HRAAATESARITHGSERGAVRLNVEWWTRPRRLTLSPPCPGGVMKRAAMAMGALFALTLGAQPSYAFHHGCWPCCGGCCAVPMVPSAGYSTFGFGMPAAGLSFGVPAFGYSAPAFGFSGLSLGTGLSLGVPSGLSLSLSGPNFGQSLLSQALISQALSV